MSAAPGLLAAVAGLRARLSALAPKGTTWLIGSGAAALSGLDGFPPPRDLDLLMDRRDADAFIDAHRARIEPGYAPADSDRFRSRLARFRFDALLPVEVMGGLEVFRDGAWQAVRIEEAQAGQGDAVPAIPSLREQLRLFEWFARDKDLVKARLIRRHLAMEDVGHVA